MGRTKKTSSRSRNTKDEEETEINKSSLSPVFRRPSRTNSPASSSKRGGRRENATTTAITSIVAQPTTERRRTRSSNSTTSVSSVEDDQRGATTRRGGRKKARPRRSKEPSETSTNIISSGVDTSRPHVKREHKSRKDSISYTKSTAEKKKEALMGLDRSTTDYNKKNIQPNIMSFPLLCTSGVGKSGSSEFKSVSKQFRIPKIKTQSNPEMREIPDKNGSRKRRINYTSSTRTRTEPGKSTSPIKETSQRGPSETITTDRPKITFPSTSQLDFEMPVSNKRTRKRRCKGSPTNSDTKERESSDTEERDNFEFESMEWENPLPEIFRMVRESPFSDAETNKTAREDDLGMEKMDVDSEPDVVEQLIIVPDTNIFISDLRLIQRLVDTQFTRVSYPTIIIPWMVLQELDVNLHGTNAKQKSKIRPVVNFIHSYLSQRHPRVKGQMAAEALISKIKFDELVADDSILNCVLQIQSTNSLVVFLTNDKNLRNKAFVNGVITCDSSSVYETINRHLGIDQTTSSHALRPMPAMQQQVIPGTLANMNNFASGSNNQNHSSRNTYGAPVSPPRTFGAFPSMNGTNSMDDVEGPTSSKIRRLELKAGSSQMNLVLQDVLEAFSSIIKHKMIEDYGETGWEYALKIKPPWTLKTAIKCILVHWIANFSFVFSRNGQCYFEKLDSLLKQHESSFSKTSEIERNIVEACMSIFNLMTNEVSNLPVVISCRKALMNLVISQGF